MLNEEIILISNRRKIASVIFGFWYGGSFFNGIGTGLDYILRGEEDSLGQWALAEAGVLLISIVLVGLSAAYVARSLLPGIIASATVSSLSFLVFSLINQSFYYTPFIFFLFSIPAAFYGKVLPVQEEDIRLGLVFGVSWKHWLWLWLPWQGVIANAVWLGTPAFLLAGQEATPLKVIYDVIKSFTCLVILGYATFKAIQSIRQDADYTRLQAAGRFIFWLFIVPILANLWRLFL
ncbi:hypothetical protein H8E77_22025 [bacterium]|nr:hypothetical protein [bacterium]